MGHFDNRFLIIGLALLGIFLLASPSQAQTNEAILLVQPAHLTFYTAQGGENPASQTISLTNAGQGSLAWQAQVDSDWLSLDQLSGTTPATITVTADASSLGFGTHQAQIQIDAAETANSPQLVEVTLSITCDDPSSVDVILALDRSSSMAGQPWIDATTAAERFVDLMNLSDDQVGLVLFNEQAILAQPLTHDGQAVQDALATFEVGGSTNIAAAVDLAREALTGSQHDPDNQPVLILLSDGHQTTSIDDPIAKARQAAVAGIRVITVGLGDVDAYTLQQMAFDPDDYYYAPTSDELAAIYTAIVVSVQCDQPALPITGLYLPMVQGRSGCADRQPIAVMLVLDRSSSMAGQPLADAKLALQTFIDTMDLAIDYVGLVSFAREATTHHSLTQDGDTLKAIITTIDYDYGTNIAAGLNNAHLEFLGPGYNPDDQAVIILLSDGRQTVPGDPHDAADYAKADGIRIITIGFGQADRGDLSEMASSAADFYFVPSSQELIDIYRDLASTMACR